MYSIMFLKNRQYYISSFKAATGVDKTNDKHSQFKAKIKKQSNMYVSAFLNDWKNLNQKYLVGFDMVQTFQYDGNKLRFLDAEKLKLTQNENTYYPYYDLSDKTFKKIVQVHKSSIR